MALILFFVTPAVPEQKPDYIIKLASPAPVDSTWAEDENIVSKNVFERSGGRVKVVWYQGNSMGDEPETIKKIRLGQLQGGYYTVMGFSAAVPEMSILSLPFLFRNYREVDYVLHKMLPTTRKVFQDKGYIFTGWLEVGFVHAFSKIGSIRTMKDMKDVKPWSPPSPPLLLDYFHELNVSKQVSLPLYDVLMGLQTGMIDTTFPTYYVCIALQWCHHLKYVNTAPLVYTPGGGIIKKGYFTSLPEKLRSIVLEELHGHNTRTTANIRKMEEESFRALVSAGIHVVEPTEEELREDEKIAWGIYPRLEGKYFTKELFDELMTYITQYRNSSRAGTRQGNSRGPARNP